MRMIGLQQCRCAMLISRLYRIRKATKDHAQLQAPTSNRMKKVTKSDSQRVTRKKGARYEVGFLHNNNCNHNVRGVSVFVPSLVDRVILNPVHVFVRKT